MKIHKSSSYELFKTIKSNRVVSELGVRRLCQSIKAIDLTPYKPIIVDKSMRIVDGQHRFEACKALGLPIYFVILKDDVPTEQAMITFNAYQKNWRQEEFLNYYANTQGGRWKELQDFEAKYKLGISNSVVVFPDISVNSTNIRKGVGEFQKDAKADDIAKFLLAEPVRSLRFSKTRPFVLAVKKAFSKYTPRQLTKLHKRMVFLQMSANYEQYLIAFDNLIKQR